MIKGIGTSNIKADMRERAILITREWITANMCDGVDRRNSGNADVHSMSSPDLYELAKDLTEFLLEEY